MNTITSIRLPNNIKNKVMIRAKTEHRSFSNLIERYLELALIAEENPDLPYSLIKEILIGLDELDEGEKTEYRFG